MPLTNTELKNLKLLRSPRRSDREKFLAEGIRVLEESVRHRVKAETILVCEDRLSDRGRTVVGRMAKLGGEVRNVSARQLDTLSDAETSQGVAAVFVRPTSALGQLGAGRSRNVLICDGISDPGNLGTLFRSALAFGFATVVVCGESADSYSPKAVRASAGAVFGLTIAVAEAEETIKWISDHQVMLLAADVSGKPLSAIAARTRQSAVVCLAVGSEARGVSPAIKKESALTVSITHEPTVESLNAAVAGSILMKGMYDLCQASRK
jgi:TrmH family RNA methyltransferase